MIQQTLRFTFSILASTFLQIQLLKEKLKFFFKFLAMQKKILLKNKLLGESKIDVLKNSKQFTESSSR